MNAALQKNFSPVPSAIKLYNYSVPLVAVSSEIYITLERDRTTSIFLICIVSELYKKRESEREIMRDI